MKKKIKLSDFDKVCVVSLFDAVLGDDVFASYRHSINTVSGLIEVLLDHHFRFSVCFYEPNDSYVESLIEDHSCFVYGILFSPSAFYIKNLNLGRF